ncbi:MAG: polymer-forming cytoskeletal protein [Pyrinomonadaceae bacterium]
MLALCPFPDLCHAAPAAITSAARQKFIPALLALLGLAVIAHAQTNTSAAKNSDALIIDGNTPGNVYALNRNVVVRGRIKQGVMVLGGDCVIEGRVEGDVATVGGSVTQREGSYIGGDVMVFGGVYHHGKTAPGRRPSSTTVMYAGYEQELREMARNPVTLVAPRPSPAYLGQRLLAVLFWFVASLALTAAAPGVVSRAAARLQLTAVRVAAIGLLGSIVMSYGVLASLKFLPSALGAVVGAMGVLLLVVAYLFGRVVIHASTGRWLQRVLWPGRQKHSETSALLLGAIFWAALLSLPFVWPLLVAGLLVASLGLALTARYRFGWKPETPSL